MTMIKPENTISLLEEMIAYEVLWGMPRQSLKSLTEHWDEKNDYLPSQILGIVEGLAQDEQLRTKVSDFLTNSVFSTDHFFNISVNGSYQYPSRLKDAKHPVRFFYFMGNLELLESKLISVVGTRKITPEGERRTKKLVKGLLQHGYTIVSGLAHGVDTVAMTTAIQEGGNVIGVIGTPINKYYPPENKQLQDQVASNHLLISHVPFYRYEHEPFNMKRLHFPERNVTMAALSMATIIVEASDTSGTLTQARACLAQGRKLFILNSCFDVPGLKWPHSYEERGAIRIREIEDVIGVLGQ
jgi:DNA processing protein